MNKSDSTCNIPDNERQSQTGFMTKFFMISAILLLFTGIAFVKVVSANFFDDSDKIKFNGNGNISAQYSVINSDCLSETSSFLEASSNSVNFPVYIVGEVENPGIYEFSKHIYIYELIEAAGGFTSKADRTALNLAYEITGNLMVYVPAIQESVTENAVGGISSEINPTEWISTTNTENNTEKKININTASEEVLMNLTGIGESSAKAIIAYREKNGSFSRIEDIMKVSGIKTSKFEMIKDSITVG